ncbi:MAG TPA: hypothetical protein HPQ04_07000 [Rhodospirillaceae bacterium]|nr:hypothetical protein [Rhodospirillaceae bacterium]
MSESPFSQRLPTEIACSCHAAAHDLLQAAEQIVAAPGTYQAFFVEMAVASVLIAKDWLEDCGECPNQSLKRNCGGNDRAQCRRTPRQIQNAERGTK